MKDLLGEALDQEFNDLELLHFFGKRGCAWEPVQKLYERRTRGNAARGRGERSLYRPLSCKGQVPVRLLGPGSVQAWIMIGLETEQGLGYYRKWMKIEESYRDLKSLRGLE